MGRIEGDIALLSWLFGFRPCSGQGQFTLPTYFDLISHIRVNCPVPNRAEIRTANFQVQYLLQFYP